MEAREFYIVTLISIVCFGVIFLLMGVAIKGFMIVGVILMIIAIQVCVLVVEQFSGTDDFVTSIT